MENALGRNTGDTLGISWPPCIGHCFQFLLLRRQQLDRTAILDPTEAMRTASIGSSAVLTPIPGQAPFFCLISSRPQAAKPWLSPVSSRGSPYSTKRDGVPHSTTKQKRPGRSMFSQTEL